MSGSVGLFSDTTFKIWDATTGLLVNSSENFAYVAIVGSSNGRLAMLTMGGNTDIWTTMPLNRTSVVGASLVLSTTASLAWHPENTFIATGLLDGRVRIWDVTNDTVVFEGQGKWRVLDINWQTSAIRGLHFSADGDTLTSVSTDGIVRIWDV